MFLLSLFHVSFSDSKCGLLYLPRFRCGTQRVRERFRKSMGEHYYRNVHAVVFVYDVAKMTSFTSLKMWIQECNGHAVPPLVPKSACGQQVWLGGTDQVPSNLALKFADAHNMLLFEGVSQGHKRQNVGVNFHVPGLPIEGSEIPALSWCWGGSREGARNGVPTGS